MAGIRPVWAAEIEPFPIRVTRKHFPEMMHLGDIRKIRGDQVEPIDILTCGSPCQSWSIAGSRQGLEGASGLFFETTRIAQEMLDATNGQSPRYILMENVPGMLSSKGGNDFETVLKEFAKLAAQELHVPRPQKWTTSGSIVADGFEVGWRVLDAQYFGVPATRRRVFIIVCPRSQGGGGGG